MKKIHVHYGSWKSASTLVQMTLRKNKGVLDENKGYFVDQQGDSHKEFAREFRKAFLFVQETGVESKKARSQCQFAATLFEQLCNASAAETVIHSWENFVGHPFSHTKRTLYHGVFTAWWFDEYLSHLPLEFTFIVRNQADLIEAMYTQEVRKGRFLGNIDEFLENFVKGRDVSWLPAVEPFFMRFGHEKVRVIPFENIKRSGSEKFLREFFSPIFDFNLNLTVDHSNPSFSGKAVEIALKTYPGLNEEQRRKEESRLVREYSNLKYPRSDFLGLERRCGLLESVAQDNRLLFDQYVSEEDKGGISEYLPLVKKSVATKKRTWLRDFYKKSQKNKDGKIKLVNLNGSEKDIPFLRVEASLKTSFPEYYATKNILISGWMFNYTVPKGGEVRLRATVLEGSNLNEVKDVTLHFVEMVGDEVGAEFLIPTKGSSFVSLTKDNGNVRYAAILASENINKELGSLKIKVEPSDEQLLPNQIEFDGQGFLPCQGTKVLPGYSKSIKDIPCKINSLESLSVFKPQQKATEKLTLKPKPFFLTIDTESFYFKRPTMMTGEGVKGAKASYEILDELDKNNLKAVFYVNVYEYLQYGDNSVEQLCKEIHERGHEVALHSHKAQQLSFYNKEIVNYNYDGQRRILEYGKELIHKWLDYEVVNFRAGGYLHDDNTLLALQDLGFKVDSSYFYKHSSAKAHQGHFVEPYIIGSLVEVPVLCLPLVMPNGTISDRKFDVNSINLAELEAVIQRPPNDLSVFSFMMHSFSFIDRKRFEVGDISKNILLKSPPLNSRGKYMGVTGLNENLWNDFSCFLKMLSVSDLIDVRLMRDSIVKLNEIALSEKSGERTSVLYR